MIFPQVYCLREYNINHQVDIKNPVGEARNEYVYSAGGTKLKVTRKWNPNYSRTPVIGSAVATGFLTQSKTTDYVGNLIYENGTLMKILYDGGYYEPSTNRYYYFVNDYQGNMRTVLYGDYGNIHEKGQYYPFGSTMAQETSYEDVQPYKFSGKEEDHERGLNFYDFHARQYESALGRFTSMDPMAEKYYSWSPYGYCKGNPVNRVDVTGMDDYVVTRYGAVHNATPRSKRGLSATDRLYYNDTTGVPEDYKNRESILVQDVSILSQLSQGVNPKERVAYTDNIKEASRIFKFAADRSHVEWKLDVYDNDGDLIAILGTQHSKTEVNKGTRWAKEKKVKGDKVIDIHSHPDIDGTKGGSPGDMKGAQTGVHNAVYHKHSQTLYHYNNLKVVTRYEPIDQMEGLYEHIMDLLNF